KSPIGCAAALATIRVIEQQQLLQKVRRDASYMAERLEAMKARLPIIGDFRGIGLLWGIELVEDRETKVRAYDAAEQVMYRCLERGLSFKVSQGNVLQLSPPLIIAREELALAMDWLEDAIE